MANPGSESLYVSAVLKNPSAASNRSVALTQAPRFMLFNGQANIMNNGAVDADGDSVVCTLVDARSSASASVTYTAGFSGASPVASQPAMSVDPLSGQVEVNPITAQNNVVAYRYDEYRGGVLVGTTVRDVLVSVVNTSNALPTLSGVNGTNSYSLQSCVGDTVAFTLYSGDANPLDSVSVEVSSAGAGANATVLHGIYPSPSGGVSDSVRIYLVANQSMTGNGPHYIYVTVRDGACPNEGVQTYVIDLSVQSCNCAITGAATTTAPYTTTLSVPVDPMATAYVWDMGDGGTAYGSTITYTYANPGTYNVCVSVTGQGAVLCTSCTTLVFTAPPSCSAAFVAVNNGLSTFFIDQSTAVTSAATYQWDFGDGASSNVRFPQHTYFVPGNYPVCLTVTDGSCSSVYCDSVLVDTLININPSCQANFVTVQMAPYQLAVINLSNGLNLTFNWDFGDGTSSSSPYPSHVYASTGMYQLCLTVSDPNGCSDTFCDTISVDSSGNMVRSSSPFSINVISPALLTGVREEASIGIFSCYPNPASDRLTIERAAESVRSATYRMFDVQGRMVLLGELNTLRTYVEIAWLPSGTYLLELIENEGYPEHIRIIKQ
jgi:PKD repeat protein